MTIRINNFFIFIGFIFSSIARFVISSITNLTPSFIIGFIFSSISNFAFSFIIVLTFDVIISCIGFIVIYSKMTYFYIKLVKAEDYTSFKLYIKRKIQIKRILFDKIINI